MLRPSLAAWQSWAASDAGDSDLLLLAVCSLGGRFRDDFGNLLERPALDRALTSRVVDEIEAAGEKAEQNRHDDGISGLPEGKAIK